MRIRVALIAAFLSLASAIVAPGYSNLENPENRENLQLIEREAYLMGTRAHLVTWDATRSAGLARLERALLVLEQTEAELSTWRADSAISTLNRTPVNTSWRAAPALCETFATLAEWHRSSGGAFDPAIGRLIDVWDLHGAGRIPLASELVRARAASGFAHLDFDRVGCTVTRRADVTVDVGAFGKGDALDRVERVLGAGPWMVDLGGQVSVHGVPPGMSGWPVAIADPQDRTRPRAHITMHEGSLSTSAGSERDVIVKGRRVGHILDPHTGAPVAFHGSVTVWHRRGLVADILSTALFAMGLDNGLRWADLHGISACYLIPGGRGQLRMVTTAAFRDSVVFSD